MSEEGTNEAEALRREVEALRTAQARRNRGWIIAISVVAALGLAVWAMVSTAAQNNCDAAVTPSDIARYC